MFPSRQTPGNGWSNRVDSSALARTDTDSDSTAYDGVITLIANRRQAGDKAEYDAEETGQRAMNPVPGTADIMFLEIDVIDPSEFSDVLRVRGIEIGGYRIMRTDRPGGASW